MPVRVNKEDFGKEVLESSKAVLVDFYSDSCVPCKRMSPLLSELESLYTDSLKIVKVNINYEKELVSEYSIQAAPTLVFFKNGEEADRIRGSAKKDEIVSAIEAII